MDPLDVHPSYIKFSDRFPPVYAERFKILESKTNKEEIKELWRGWTFPLIFTENFHVNWDIILNDTGIFTIKYGERCSVKPRETICRHYEKDETSYIYEAIVFSRIAFQIHMEHSLESIYNKSKPNALGNGDHLPIIERRIFIDRYLTRLPDSWIRAALKYELHVYEDPPASNDRGMRPDIYKPLRQMQNIRLIALLPVSPDKPFGKIQCLLGEESFDSCRPYEALSYVWGDPMKTRPITVNGRPLDVTENLEAALRELRFSNGKIRILWIDAVCINQADSEEKGHQVGMMDVIYKKAEEVVVWLGRESNKTSMSLEHARFFSGLPMTKGLPQHFPFRPEPFCADCGGPLSNRTRPGHSENLEATISYQNATTSDFNTGIISPSITSSNTPRFLHDERMLSLIHSYTAILKRPWWRRIWVIQEFALASKVNIRCGSHSVDWQSFRSALFLLVRVGQRSRRGQNSTCPNTLHSAYSDLTQAAFAALPFALLAHMDSLASSAIPYQPTLPKLLALSRFFEATNPRDYLYALRGVLPEGSKGRDLIAPDYTVHARHIFVRFAREFLGISRTLDILGARSPFIFAQRPMFLPSWAPDWSAKVAMCDKFTCISVESFSYYKSIDTFTQNLGGGSSTSFQKRFETFNRSNDHLFNASFDRETPIRYQFSIDGEILYVYGLLIDEIMETTVWPSGNIQNAHKRFIDQCKRMCRVKKDKEYRYTDHSRKEAFWRTVLLDRYWANLSSSDSGRNDSIKRIPQSPLSISLYVLFSGRGPKLNTFPPETAEDETTLLGCMRREYSENGMYNGWSCHSMYKPMMKTKEDYFGVCPGHTLPGDRIAILLGGSVPFVLRPYREYYVIVGECYVHGIMDGEAVVRKRQEGGTDEELFTKFSII